MSDEVAILAINAAYYEAFSGGDLVSMGRIWADDNVSCIHPGWPVVIGREGILESYGEIMRNPKQDPVVPTQITVLKGGEEARVICVETLRGVALAATNIFKRIAGEWRMTHHQASPIAALIEEALTQIASRRLH